MRRRVKVLVVVLTLAAVAGVWLWPRATGRDASSAAETVRRLPGPSDAGSSARRWGDAAWRGTTPERSRDVVRVVCELPVGMSAQGLRVRAWHVDATAATPPGGSSGAGTTTHKIESFGGRAGAKIVSRGDGQIELAFPRPAAPTEVQGNLDSPGAGRARLSVHLGASEGTCAVEPLKGYAFVSGRVIGAGGSDGETHVFGCGGGATADSSGAFYLEALPEPCELVAMRQDGAFSVRSEPVPVDPKSGAEITLDLSLPAYRAAGVGTQIKSEDGGIRVVQVIPGTPAAEAGLAAGDLVVALDGADVSGLDSDAFIALALGRAGTPVTYSVVRDGETLDVVMTRRALDDPRTAPSP